MKPIKNSIYQSYNAKQKSLALLIDPDKADSKAYDELLMNISGSNVDYILVGGSLISSGKISKVLNDLAYFKQIPKIIFPGNSLHIDQSADALLFLSLISGRNAEFLIGQQVLAAPLLYKSSLEILSTGYILVDGGNQTTVAYISNTTPIPNDKPDIAVATALAGQMIGHSLIYLDCGSGAKTTVSNEMIAAVRSKIELPLIVGGGIRTKSQAFDIWKSGADIIVVGNSLEENPNFLTELSELKAELNLACQH